MINSRKPLHQEKARLNRRLNEYGIKPDDAPSTGSRDNHRHNAVMRTMRRKVKSADAGTLQKMKQAFGSDFQQLSGLIDVLNTDRLSTFGSEGFDVSGPVEFILDHMINHREQQQIERSVLDALSAGEKPDPEYRAVREIILAEGMTKLIQIQDSGQHYHTILHALEMRDDTQNTLDAIYPDLPLFTELVANLAAYHDIIQLKGQYINEAESAAAFCQDFAKHYQDRYDIGPAMLQAVAENIIISGTLLSVSFEPPCPKHLTLQRILADIDLEVLSLPPRDNPWNVAACALTHMDVSRATTGEQPSLPPGFEGILGTSTFSPSFNILIGQNLRMLADGPEKIRTFKNDMLPVLNSAMTLARVAAIPGLTEDQLGNALDKLKNFIVEHLDVFLSGIDFSDQIGFAGGMDSRHGAETMARLGSEKAAAMLCQSVHGHVHDNAWDTHQLLAIGLNETIERHVWENDKDKLSELFAALLFVAANQHGTRLLATNIPLLTEIAEACYGAEPPDEMTPEDGWLYAIAHLHIAMQPGFRETFAMPQRTESQRNHFSKAVDALREQVNTKISELRTMLKPTLSETKILQKESDLHRTFRYF